MWAMRALVVLLLLASRAHAGPSEAIVLTSSEPTFQVALRETLAPAGISVILATDVTAPSISEIAGASRELADRLHASSTVWLVFSDAGATLVAYDRGVDRVLVRPLPSATVPLSTSQAEEASRMVRTMLRALRITPDSNLPPPHPAEAAIVRTQAARAERPVQVARLEAPPPAPAVLGVELGAGMRIRGPGDPAAATATLAVILRPQALGVAVTAHLAPNSDVAAAGVMGRISDDSVAITARYGLVVAPGVTVAGSAGVAVHRVRLRGVVMGGAPVDEDHVDPAARVGASAVYALGPFLGLGLVVSADCLLRRQKYDAGPEEVLSVPLVQLTAAVVFRARVW
ncbi:MAG: hypothetical protein H6Q90_5981 [Deltaproteobacteria bacterium]|nr:hypothetical protein [Deltaproteobacteria bacterium]